LGFVVFGMQVTFLLLMLLNVVNHLFNTGKEDLDNPVKITFSPTNVGFIVTMTQYVAVVAYVFFVGDSINDVIAAVEGFPSICRSRKTSEMKLLPLLILLNVCRLLRVSVAVVVTVVLVISSSDVVEIVLNFAAENYISSLDEAAFNLAKKGRYGDALEMEAKRINRSAYQERMSSAVSVSPLKSCLSV